MTGNRAQSIKLHASDRRRCLRRDDPVHDSGGALNVVTASRLSGGVLTRGRCPGGHRGPKTRFASSIVATACSAVSKRPTLVPSKPGACRDRLEDRRRPLGHFVLMIGQCAAPCRIVNYPVLVNVDLADVLEGGEVDELRGLSRRQAVNTYRGRSDDFRPQSSARTPASSVLWLPTSRHGRGAAGATQP
jgi:hypothetical protein